MSTKLRSLLIIGAIVACAAACSEKPRQPAPQSILAEEPRTLSLLHRPGYVSADTLRDFQAATGIKIRYEVLQSHEMLEARLLAGKTGFDVVIASAAFLERQVRAGVFRKLDKSRLPNLANLDARLMQRLELHDAGNAQAVPYLWNTAGIGYNEQKVRQITPDAPLDSWDVIFDPEFAAKLQECGIAMFAAPNEVLKLALAWLGRDPNSQQPEDLAAAGAKLKEIRPYLRDINTGGYVDELASGELCVAVGWRSDIQRARKRASSRGGTDIRYVIPKEGSLMGFDVLAIPANATHVDDAHTFINYMMDRQVAAHTSNHTHQANANAASFELLSDVIRNDPAIYPAPEVTVRLFPALAPTEESARLIAAFWTQFLVTP